MIKPLTKLQRLHIDQLWYEHRFNLLKERKVHALAEGSVDGWRRANTVAESMRALQAKLVDIRIQVAFEKRTEGASEATDS